MSLPRISILTPSFNQGAYIEQNIRSVLDQGYPNVEHIVIDGGSTDNTVEILKRYPHLKWVSEKDRGQADALNKGLALATGEIIGWINSDDFYEKNIFATVAGHFADQATQWVVGNLTRVWEGLNLQLAESSQSITYAKLLRNADIVAQPGTFFRKSAIEAAAGWNADLHMVMDFDLWVRLARMYAPKMVDANWAYFRMHADQKSTWRNLTRQIREINRILRRERVPFVYRLPLLTKKEWYIIKGIAKSFLISVRLLAPQDAGIPMSLKKHYLRKR